MENVCVPWDNFKAELRLCVLKDDFFDKVKDIEAKFPFFASRAGMEGANRKLEELQRYATDKFKDIKEEFTGINRDYVTNYKLAAYDKT